MERVGSWCGQPLDRGWLKNRTEPRREHVTDRQTDRRTQQRTGQRGLGVGERVTVHDVGHLDQFSRFGTLWLAAERRRLLHGAIDRYILSAGRSAVN